MGPMLTNRRARHDYDVLETFEAGLALTGSEVKSLRRGGASIAEAYAKVERDEVWLEGANIPTYPQASYNNHEPMRARKLLLHRREIEELRKGLERRGLTVVPLKLYFDARGKAKLQIALARGRKLHDKRAAASERDAKREMDRALKGSSR
jgi:SsrA-binding protein